MEKKKGTLIKCPKCKSINIKKFQEVIAWVEFLQTANGWDGGEISNDYDENEIGNLGYKCQDCGNEWEENE